MDKAIIYGTYDFLGFALCVKLLEQGFQVEGNRWFQEESEEFLEEKKLMIGRNANFEEQIVGVKTPTTGENIIEDTVTFLSFYDLYFSSFRNSLNTHENSLRGKIENIMMNSSGKLVCLFPNDFLYEIPISLREPIEMINKEGNPYQAIYLPTLYGPWQPATFLYQQFFLQEYSNVNLILDKRENTLDAIFIYDAVNEIIRLIRSPESNNIQIQCEQSGQWKKGVQYLALENVIPNERKKTDKLLDADIKIVKLVGKTSIKEGLELQKQHLAILLKPPF